MENISLVIGGKAGEGVRAAGHILGKVFNKAGYHVFIRDDYPSLIKGGHNYSQINISSEKTRSQKRKIDILGAFDKKTIEEHDDELKKDSLVVINSDKTESKEEIKSIGLPISSWRKELGGSKIIENSAYVAAIISLCGLNFELLKTVLKQKFGDKSDLNIEIAEKAYEKCQKNYEVLYNLKEIEREDLPLLTGNQALLLGAVAAGLDFYIAYPMTPSTSILHFAAENMDKLGIAVMQPENEIGVLNIGLGASYAGAKTMVGTSGGGYDLMQEPLSLAGMSETPILVVNAQRAGPSTGVPTHTSQPDLKFAINAGHGEFPHIVVAPGDVKEAFELAGEALNLAWKYQTPVTLLSDKHLSESVMNCKINPNEIEKASAENSREMENYLRYKKTPNGISPLKYPGKDVIVKNNSYEHTEEGYTTEKPNKIEEMQEKRLKKMETIRKNLKEEKTVKRYGKNDKNFLVTWGSTKGSVLEAKKELNRGISVIQPLYMRPFPKKQLKKTLNHAQKIFVIENNATGQLSSLLEEKCNIEIDEIILKYDMRPFYPIKLAKKIKEVFKK